MPTISETPKFETSPLCSGGAPAAEALQQWNIWEMFVFLFKCYGLTSIELLDVVGSEIRQSIQGW